MLCFESTVSKASQLLDKLLQEHFGRYKELERLMRTLTYKERDVHREETRKVLGKLLRRESDPLYTQNSEALQAEKRTWLAKYNQYPPAVPRPGSNLDPWFYPSYQVIHRFPKKTFPHIPDGNHSTQDELETMAGVQAYFQVAHKRFIDYVPLTIEHELNQAFAESIDKTMFTAVSNNAEEGQVDLHALLREDPAIERRRKELTERKDRLVKIKEKLDHFRQTSSTNVVFPEYDQASEFGEYSPVPSEHLAETPEEYSEGPRITAVLESNPPYEVTAPRISAATFNGPRRVSGEYRPY